MQYAFHPWQYRLQTDYAIRLHQLAFWHLLQPGFLAFKYNAFSRLGMQAILSPMMHLFGMNQTLQKMCLSPITGLSTAARTLGENNCTIAMAPESHSDITDNFVHSNIRILNNHFIVTTKPPLFARRTDKFIFNDNILQSNLACSSTILMDDARMPSHSYHGRNCQDTMAVNNVFAKVLNSFILFVCRFICLSNRLLYKFSSF
ncbi:hypothetical protein [Foetidibacter luteolus]|uniref:hypothetical protein n=1 Tax=Foetidibacter luteolus TaxID=2608880 RepID=UPI001A9832C6|nr:hypothetical protein [Foetidibacter luteolus]